MTLTVLAEYLLVAAEFTFVACFLGNEIMRYALRGRITRFEQFAHSIPQRRYLSQFSVPLTTVLAGAGAGAGAGLVASIHDGLLVQDLGLAVLIATMIPFGRFQLDVAAGVAPRPVRLKRLFEAGAVLRDRQDPAGGGREFLYRVPALPTTCPG